MKIVVTICMFLFGSFQIFDIPVEDILTNGTYTSYNHLILNSQSGNFEGVIDSCEMDQTWDFSTNNILEIGEGSAVCDSSYYPIYMKYKWNLNVIKDKLSLIYYHDTLNFKIDYINSDSLVLIAPYNYIINAKLEKIVLKR